MTDLTPYHYYFATFTDENVVQAMDTEPVRVRRYTILHGPYSTVLAAWDAGMEAVNINNPCVMEWYGVDHVGTSYEPFSDDAEPLVDASEIDHDALFNAIIERGNTAPVAGEGRPRATYDADMIERVAEAIYNVDRLEAYDFDEGTWGPAAWDSDHIGDELREMIREQAVAALEAAGIHAADRPERVHPSDYLVETLHERGWTIADLVNRAHLSLRVIEEVLHYGRPITPIIAKRLALALDTSPDLWLDLQRAYDERNEP